MTIAAGFHCADGIVLCADRQFTSPGYFKYHEPKIVIESGSGWDLAFAFSGLPGFAEEVRQKAMAVLRPLRAEELQAEYVREVLDDVITGTARLHITGDPELRLLAAINVWLDQPQLLQFDGRSLRIVEKGFAYIGCGESSLIRYLSDHLYTASMSVEEGASFGAYLIKKAEEYIDGCGGPIDVVILEQLGNSWLSQEQVNARIEKMEKQEKLLSNLLIQKPFSSSI